MTASPRHLAAEDDPAGRSLASDLAMLRLQLASATAENEALRETLDAIDGTVVVFDAEQRFLFANQSYHQLFQHLPPAAALERMHYADILALSIAAGTVADPAARLDPAAFITRRVGEMDDRSITAREVHHAEGDRWSQIRVRWTPSGNRVALRIDITELKRLQQRVLRAERMDSFSRISGGVAHDFNNLLTVIVSSLEMIELRASETPKIRRWAAIAMGAAETGARLIRQLLTFAHRDVVDPRLLTPNFLLDGMRARLLAAIGPSVGLELVLDPDCGQASFDPAQFEAAILNLVLNAVEAGQMAGSATPIVIRTGNSGDAVTISVTDQGCGMAAEVAAQAFEPFYTTKPIGGGPGLGLSQVYGFATGAGGQVQIDTQPGAGTTVTIELPRA